MIFNIPKWPDDSDVTHYATTWALCKDKDCITIEEEVDKSSDFLLAWENDVIIPTGEIWYIKALRHLKDSDGNDINNTKWIGPKPVFNEESNVNDYLAPKFTIDTPYIDDLSYVPGESLTITLSPYNGNIGYEKTVLSIINGNGEYILTKFFDIRETENVISITSDDLDFNSENKVTIVIAHSGLHSVVSPVYKETLYLKKVYFDVIGNTFNLDPRTPNTITIKSTSNIGITVTSAKVFNMGDVFIEECTVSNNTITLPVDLEYNESYKVKLLLTYINSTGNTDTIDYTVVISTMNTIEEQIINENITYNYIISKFTEVDKDGPYDLINTDLAFNTEEFATNLIPLVDIYTNNLSLYILDKVEKLYAKAFDTNLTVNSDFTIRLLNSNLGFLQTVDTDNKLVKLDLFYYDTIRDAIYILKTLTIETPHVHPGDLNVVSEVADSYFVTVLNKGNDKQIDVYELVFYIDTVNQSYIHELVLKQSLTMVESATSVSSTNLGTDKVLIVPNKSSEIKTYVYSVNDNTIVSSLVIPSDFRNKDLYLTTLSNGDIKATKRKDTDKTLDYFYLDISDNSFKVKKLLYNGSGVISNITTLRNGYILNGLVLDDKKEIWLFS